MHPDIFESFGLTSAAAVTADVQAAASPEERRRWVCASARLLFGKNWRGPLAAVLGVSRSLCQAWDEGKLAPKPAVVGAVYEMLEALERRAQGARSRCPRGAAAITSGSPALGDWTSVPTVTFTYDIEPGLVGVDPATAAAVREGYARTLAEAKAAAPPAERPKRRGRPPAVTEENIAKELGVRGIRVFLAPPPRFNLTREQAAQERLDHAAGKVVYWSELMQHAHILQE